MTEVVIVQAVRHAIAIIVKLDVVIRLGVVKLPDSAVIARIYFALYLNS
jgi:hypothetical protein